MSARSNNAGYGMVLEAGKRAGWPKTLRRGSNPTPGANPFPPRNSTLGPRHRSGERCAIPYADSRAWRRSSWRPGFFS